MAKSGNSILRWNAADGIINFCNGRFSKKCDASPAEIIGKHIEQLRTDNGVMLSQLDDLNLRPGELQTNTLLWKGKDGCEHHELTTVQAFSKDGKTVSEIEIAGLENVDELRFRETLDSLLAVFSDNECKDEFKIQRLLDIGLDYFNMQSGVVGSTMGNSLDLICACGLLAKDVKRGDIVPMEGRVCDEVLETDGVVTWHNMPVAANDDGSCVLKMRSYIGTQVLTHNGPLGIISFFSDAKREQSFTENDNKIINLIANWIGTVLGNEEQLEFLSAQNDYYQSLFSTVPAMMMLCNQDGLILSTSELLSHRIGIDPLSVPGKNCHRFFIDDNTQDLTNALIQGDIDHLPLTLRYENGDTLEVEYSSSIKHIGSMQGVRMIVLADVSERNQAMRSVEEQNKQLALVNQSLNQFAFIASHDLQEPLRKIIQFSSFLEEDMAEVMTDDGQHHIDVITKSAHRMTTLIQDLLAFSSAAKGDLEFSDINLNFLIAQIAAELDMRIEESNAKLIIAELPVVQGDLSLVRQLLTNLIGNSIKYRAENRDPIIQINFEFNERGLKLMITDNGIGFDQKHASKAFEPFNRLHSDEKYVGNGIGLSICSMICEKHDWELSARSKPDSGSVFTITMPLP